jgi:uncharacterized iron-regulated membrane protein
MTTSRPQTLRPFKFRTWLRRIHLWTTLTLGFALVLITLSGVAALYLPEYNRVVFAELFRSTPSQTPISYDRVMEIATETYPELFLDRVSQNRPGDSYQVFFFDTPNVLFVDSGTGEVRGTVNLDATLLGRLAQFHTTLFLPHDDTALGIVRKTIYTVLTLCLFLMIVTGIYLWWPGLKKFYLAFKVRSGKSNYLRNHDWHKLVGFIALPFLLMTAITSFDFEQYEIFGPFWGWLTRTPPQADYVDAVLEPSGRTPVSYDAAVTAALADTAGARFVTVYPPFDETGTIDVFVAKAVDSRQYGVLSGSTLVQIDQYTGEVLDNQSKRVTQPANVVYNWFFGLHTGWFAPWYVRLVWMLFGLVPFFLAITGVAMWLHKRKGQQKIHVKSALKHPVETQ